MTKDNWNVEHRILRSRGLGVEFDVSIYFVPPESPVDGPEITLYELEGQEVSREDLVRSFGSAQVEDFERDIAVG